MTVPTNRDRASVIALVGCALVALTHEAVGAVFVAQRVGRSTQTQYVAGNDRKYTITPALIDAVSRRETDANIDTDIHRHGVAGLAVAIDRERGEVTHRLMAVDLDISPLAAEMVLQALRPVVREHYDIEEFGASFDVDNFDRK